MVKRLFPQQIKGIDGNYGARIKKTDNLYKFEIHAFSDTLSKVNTALKKQIGVTIPTKPAQTIENGKVRAMWLAPCKAFIVSPKPLKINISSQLALVSEQSDGRMGVRLSGEYAQYVLQKGITVPLDGDNFVAQTSLHGISLIIDAHHDGFDVYFYRSFAVSFQEWLLQAALEYGYMRE